MAYIFIKLLYNQKGGKNMGEYKEFNPNIKSVICQNIKKLNL